MIVRRPSSHLTTSSASSASSTGSSIKPPSVLTDDCGTDDDEVMSGDEYLPARPLSVAIPSMSAHGPYCPRRPNLREILADTSPPPWTLTAFMQYLSSNHCLETLEFTMDAGRYRKHYAKMMSRASENGVPPAKDCEYVRALWQRLVDAYIRTSGSREVNLPSSVRNPILQRDNDTMPPPPETLDPAVTKIYELMEDSVLVPFLNSVYPQSAHPSMQSCVFGTSTDGIGISRTFEDASLYNRRTNHHNSSPPQLAVNPYAHPHANALLTFRQSAPVALGGLSHRSRFNTKLSQTTSSPTSTTSAADVALTDAPFAPSGSGSSVTVTTDDSGSTGSPTNESPSTPPLGGPSMSDVSSPKRDSGMWKKLGRLSGMKPGKKKSHGGLKAEDE